LVLRSGIAGGTLAVAGGVTDGNVVDGYLAAYDTEGNRRGQARLGSDGVDLFSGVTTTRNGTLGLGLTRWTSSDGDAWIATVSE